MAIWEFDCKSTSELEILRDIIKDIEDCGIQQSEEMKDALEVELCERSTTFDPKPLAQYLMEYIEHETGMDCHYGTWRELLEQALDAYQLTENVTIKIERNVE